MASELLYPGILFTITLTCIVSEGHSNDAKVIDPGVYLVPEPHRIFLLEQKSVLLLNCSLNVTDKTLLPLNYSWFKDGKDIFEERKQKNRTDKKQRRQDETRLISRVQLLSNGSLYFPNGSFSTVVGKRNKFGKIDGLYECIVNTTRGAIYARRVRVVMVGSAHNFTVQPTSFEAYKGGVARFECNLKSEPSTTYIWHKGDVELPQDVARYTFLPSGVLQISDVQVSDEGFYWCQAAAYPFTVQESVKFYWKTSRQAELKVITDSNSRPIKFLSGPQNVSVLEGESAILECLVDGNPKPVVGWSRKGNGESIGNGIFGPGNLKIARAKPEHAGIYECKATSRTNSEVQFVNLQVEVPPKDSQEPGIASAVGLSTIFKAPVSGTPKSNFTWYHNGKLVTENRDFFPVTTKNKIKGNEVLILLTQQKYHSGFYVCLIENTAGQAMTMIYLNVTLHPFAAEKPVNVRAVALNSTAVNITFDHNQTEGLPYVLNYQAVGNYEPAKQQFITKTEFTSHHYSEVVGLEPYTVYWFSVYAYTKYGVSELTERVYVQTLEDVPAAVPKITVSVREYYNALVTWTPLTPAQSRGIVTGYRVYYRQPIDDVEIVTELSADQTSCLITGLEPGNTYEVLVLASTSAGFPKRDNAKWTIFSLSPADNSSPPMLSIKYVNMSAVKLEWQAPKIDPPPSGDHSVIGYELEISEGEEEDVKVINLSPTDQFFLLTDLDNDKLYEVTLFAKTKAGLSAPITRDFKLEALAPQLVPSNFKALEVTSNSILLDWSPIAASVTAYEVCYRFELDKSDWLCRTSNLTSITVPELQPFKWYEFKIRALIPSGNGDFSNLLTVQTKEGKSSAPLNFTLEIIKPGYVLLRWLPPTEPNGIITSYVILYTKEGQNPKELMWKAITQQPPFTHTEKDISAQIEELDAGRYYFKLAAVNSNGQGIPTDNLTVEFKCQYDSPLLCKESVHTIVTTDKPAPVAYSEIGLILGIVAGVFCLTLVVVIVIYCRHRLMLRDQDPNASHRPIYRGNGHISPPPNHTGHHMPGNGHTHIISMTPGNYIQDVTNLHESTPMLHQIPENEQSDSKGGPDIITPNGIRPNGFVKANHKLVGQTIISRSSGDLNSSNNSEELQGLMTAMLTSTDGSDTLASSIELIPMSSLDDIDHNDDELGDHSSEDSGTGCRRAGMPYSELHPNDSSPGNSPGGSSKHRVWEKGRQVDEIGGVFIDRSTGAVIGEVSPLTKFLEEIDGEQNAVEGESYEDASANDRDSGHGSEVKSHTGIVTCMNDSLNISTGQNYDEHSSQVMEGCQFSEQNVEDLSNSPQESPLSPLQSSSAQSSQQLSCSSSRNISSNSRPQHNHHQHPRGMRQHISHSDLPPPPPPPPPLLLSPTLPTPQGSLAAVTATTAATAELNSSGSIDEGGQQRANDSGSILSRHLEVQTAVVFSQPHSPPSPPNVA